MLADLAFYKGRTSDLEAQVVAANLSRDNWKGLYESEKKRADEIQGERIRILTEQSAADRQKIGEQNAEIIRLKSDRKWWFAAGAVAGGFGGYYIGKNQDRIVQTVSGNNFAPPSAATFGTKFRF